MARVALEFQGHQLDGANIAHYIRPSSKQSNRETSTAKYQSVAYQISGGAHHLSHFKMMRCGRKSRMANINR